jgi:hypothetical protein
MKPKTMFYAALGLATFKAGKLFGKRRVREAVGDLREGRKRREARRRD